MTRSTKSLALQIAQLLEDNSEKELQEAVQLLREHNYGSVLFDFLSDLKFEKTHVPEKSREAPSAAKPLDETTSRAVLNLKDTDPEKFEVLSRFDQMIRRGHLLSTHEALRRFGERLSKDFEPRKARKDTIGALMATVAARPVREIEELVDFAASFGVSGDSDEYHKLAEFIIKGKRDS